MRSQNVLIKLNAEVEKIPCKEDTISKKISLSKIENNNLTEIITFISNKCENNFQYPLTDGNYKVIINSGIYEEQHIEFQIKNQQPVDLGTILLKKVTYKEIKAINIIGEKKQYVKVDAEKTTYTVKNNPILSTGMISDAVKKLPGVITSPSGSLAMNGKNMSIYIDGIPSNLSGQDLINYIQSLPANTVEKIELISNPGASFEANTSGGIINIITFSKSKKGLNGTLNLHYGINKNNKPAPSLILNGRGEKNSWQLQTGYNYIESNNSTDTYRSYYTFSLPVNFTQSINAYDINRNFYLRPMINFKVTENSNIIFNYNLNIANNYNNSVSNSFTENYSSNIVYSNNSISSNKNNNNEFILKYKTKLDSIGKTLQITSYYSIYNKTNNTNAIEDNNERLYSKIKNSLKLNNFYIKYDFEIPFNHPKITINTGGKYNYFNASNIGAYNLSNPSEYILHNNEYLNYLDFNYLENSFAFYAEIKNKFGKLSATMGLRMEDFNYKSRVLGSNLRIEKHLNNLFPTVHLLYEIHKDFNIVASYTKKISMPPYNQLDPNNSGYFDLYNSNNGNQFLEPNFYNNYSCRITAFSWAQLGTDYSNSKNVGLMTYIAEPKSLNTSQTYITYDKIKYFSIYASIPIPFGLISKGKKIFNQPLDIDKMSGLLIYASYNDHKVNGFVYPFNQKSFWQFYLQSQIILPYKLKLSADLGYMTKGTYQIYNVLDPVKTLNLNISRKFLNDKLETSIHILDVFKSFKINGIVPSENLTVNYLNTNDSRVFWLKLTYNFGKRVNKNETEIENEKRIIEKDSGLNVIKK